MASFLLKDAVVQFALEDAKLALALACDISHDISTSCYAAL